MEDQALLTPQSVGGENRVRERRASQVSPGLERDNDDVGTHARGSEDGFTNALRLLIRQVSRRIGPSHPLRRKTKILCILLIRHSAAFGVRLRRSQLLLDSSS